MHVPAKSREMPKFSRAALLLSLDIIPSQVESGGKYAGELRGAEDGDRVEGQIVYTQRLGDAVEICFAGGEDVVSIMTTIVGRLKNDVNRTLGSAAEFWLEPGSNFTRRPVGVVFRCLKRGMTRGPMSARIRRKCGGRPGQNDYDLGHYSPLPC